MKDDAVLTWNTTGITLQGGLRFKSRLKYLREDSVSLCS